MIGTALRVAIGAGYEPYGPAPSDLGATVQDWDDIQLDWTDNTGDEDGFIIERKAGAGAWSELDTVGAGVTTYHDTDITRNTEYTYRVRAYLGARKSPQSDEATFDIPATVGLSWANMQTGGNADTVSMTASTIRAALDRVLDYWEYAEEDWPDWTCGSAPGSPLNLDLTLAAAGIGEGSTLYAWLA